MTHHHEYVYAIVLDSPPTPVQERLDAQGKREVNLWHPDSPGMRVWVRPGFWRRTGINRSPFATLSEMINMDKRREQR